MIGLICIGLMGLSAVLFLTSQNRGAQEVAVVLPTDTPPLPTFTATSTETATPTLTPEPTATATRVVALPGEEAAQPGPGEALPPDPNATPTATLVIQPPVTEITPPVVVSTPGLPPGGGELLIQNSYLAWFGLGVLALLAFGAIRHLHYSRRSPEE